MPTPTPRGDRDGRRAWEDEAGEATEPPFRRLSREEAQALAKRDPSVSPWRVVAAQALAGAVCTLIAAVWGGSGAAWSAVYGAAAVVLPNALLARGMTRRTGNAVASAAGFMFWELLKIGVSIAMLVIAAKVVPDLSWPVLLATMVVGMKVNWFALLWRGR
jgi:ATP synthase protein I